MDLSIIIVTWNNEKEIAECLKSLQKTIKHHKYEVIVVDNASKDSTKIIVKKLHGVVLIDNSDNLGFARANNLALRNSTGKYVLFLNPDTIMQEKTIDSCLDFFAQHIKYGALACRLLNADGSTQPSIYKLPSYLGIFIENFNLQNYFPRLIGSSLGYSHKYSHKIECCMGAFILMQRKDVIEIGGFSEFYFMYMEDGDLCWKIKYQLNKEIYFIHNLTCVHLGGCSEQKDVSVSKLSKMLLSTVLFWQIRNPQRWRSMISYYRTIYGLKMLLAKFLVKIGRHEYKKNVENCQESRILLKEKLKEL